jgi:hypothetical protein
MVLTLEKSHPKCGILKELPKENHHPFCENSAKSGQSAARAKSSHTSLLKFNSVNSIDRLERKISS